MLAERTGVDALMVDHQGKTWLTAGMSRRLKTV
jgi:thiamine biosynthesis lipoprotein ApbE